MAPDGFLAQNKLKQMSTQLISAFPDLLIFYVVKVEHSLTLPKAGQCNVICKSVVRLRSLILMADSRLQDAGVSAVLRIRRGSFKLPLGQLESVRQFLSLKNLMNQNVGRLLIGWRLIFIA